MAELRVIVQLIEDDGTRHQNEVCIDLSEFKDPEMVEEEDRVHAFNKLFIFLEKSAKHFVKYWAASVVSKNYFEGLGQYARSRGMGEADTVAMVVGATHSTEGNQHLQLPLQVLEPKEGEDFPRPKFLSRYKRKSVI